MKILIGRNKSSLDEINPHHWTKHINGRSTSLDEANPHETIKSTSDEAKDNTYLRTSQPLLKLLETFFTLRIPLNWLVLPSQPNQGTLRRSKPSRSETDYPNSVPVLRRLDLEREEERECSDRPETPSDYLRSSSPRYGGDSPNVTSYQSKTLPFQKSTLGRKRICKEKERECSDRPETPSDYLPSASLISPIYTPMSQWDQSIPSPSSWISSSKGSHAFTMDNNNKRITSFLLPKPLITANQSNLKLLGSHSFISSEHQKYRDISQKHKISSFISSSLAASINQDNNKQQKKGMRKHLTLMGFRIQGQVHADTTRRAGLLSLTIAK
ncbi:hypothetical protein Fmac_021060 [Flemingia macrophylla]|uniref:Uncharacterized protein n=1 Tax=Flemingia macrophylla TaxID=520843 RepID=A0ABD1LWA5_9FABA